MAIYLSLGHLRVLKTLDTFICRSSTLSSNLKGNSNVEGRLGERKRRGVEEQRRGLPPGHAPSVAPDLLLLARGEDEAGKALGYRSMPSTTAGGGAGKLLPAEILTAFGRQTGAVGVFCDILTPPGAFPASLQAPKIP